MPLKHSTETFLIAVLAVLLVCAGIAVRVLWSLGTAMLLWWALPLLATLLYPLVLHPLLKSSRAEYSLRALHFAPFLIVLFGFLLTVGATKLGALATLAAFYAFGGSLAAVSLALFLLTRFCMAVLRQWNKRVPVLTALFIPFLIGSLGWEGWRSGSLQGGLLGRAATSSTAGSSTSVVAVTSAVNTSPSANANEELVRMQLRRMARRNTRLATQTGTVSVIAAVRGALAASTLSLQKQKPIAYDPDHLPASGFGVEPLALTMLAGYTALIHERARRRKGEYAALHAA